MANTELNSFIGWIDLSEEDQKRARDYLRSLSEGTLDELGFGIIRDALADKFFPATSTIMTRARYFILVPSIYLRVLEQGLVGERAKKRCAQLERKLRSTLISNGTIENWRKEEVKRYPASIYWAAIRRLNICNSAIGSQVNYFSSLKSYFHVDEGMDDDDKNVHESESEFEIWQPEISHLFDANKIPKPDSKGEFEGSIDFDLTKTEADYLKKRFLESETESVIANVFRHEEFEKADYPWEWEYPEGLETEIGYAQHFSMLAKFSTLVYYELLNAKRIENSKPSVDTDLVEALELWWQATRDILANWNVDEFNNWIAENKICRGSDLHFFKTMHRHLVDAKSAHSLVKSKKVHDLIIFREKDKRPNKRRLIPGRFQNEWKLPTQSSGYFSDPEHIKYHLNFRSGIASTIIGDIFEGIKR